MEWMNRDNSQTANAPAAAGTSSTPHSRGSKGGGIFKSLRVVSVALLFSVTILILALVAYTVLGGTSSSGEGKYVKTKQMQAVFLNGGQVYFGHINSVNDKYLRMSDIYYLRVNQQVQPNQSTTATTASDISLVKLGCELHGPDDQMIIKQAQVIFWENLKDDGQVAKAVATYKQQNPNGQKCDTTSQSNANSTTPTTTTPTTTNTTTTPTTKKP